VPAWGEKKEDQSKYCFEPDHHMIHFLLFLTKKTVPNIPENIWFDGIVKWNKVWLDIQLCP